MTNSSQKRLARNRRHARVRSRVVGSTSRPRLNVYRSLNHIYAQVIDDSQGNTLVAASSIDKAIQASLTGKSKIEQAKEVGKLIAERSLEAGISEVVFDRGGYQYHGRVKALADASREAGLRF